MTRSRRRPRLRVVSGTRSPRRHVLALETGPTHAPTDVFAEIWTFEEWDRLEEWERPDGALFIPYLGWAEFRNFRDKDEKDNVIALRRQAIDEYWACHEGEL
jgi:hypothetical protein